MLVFCASRKQCQSCAELLAELLPLDAACAAVGAAAQEARQALVLQMQDAMGGFSNVALEKLMLAGLSLKSTKIVNLDCISDINDGRYGLIRFRFDALQVNVVNEHAAESNAKDV